MFLFELYPMYKKYKISENIIYNVMRKKNRCSRNSKLLHWNIVSTDNHNIWIEQIYRFKFKEDIELESECFSYYITYNPINYKTFYKDLIKTLLDNYDRSITTNERYSITRIILSEYMKHITKKPLLLIDIDSKRENVIENIKSKLKDKIEFITDTPNGYHILVPIAEVGEDIFRNHILDDYNNVIEYKRNSGLNITNLINKR